MISRAAHTGVMVVVVVIATGAVGYYVAKGAWGVARHAFRDFVSG
jgi:hypothetical protein